MKKQPHITEQTKNNLRIAFWSLYAQKPIEKISIKEITELAGYNRGTFYLYYNDVYDLLHQIEEEILGKITDVLNDSLEKNDTFDLSGQMGILLDLMQTYETYAAVLLSDHGDPHFATRLKEVVWPLLISRNTNAVTATHKANSAVLLRLNAARIHLIIGNAMTT